MQNPNSSFLPGRIYDFRACFFHAPSAILRAAVMNDPWTITLHSLADRRARILGREGCKMSSTSDSSLPEGFEAVIQRRVKDAVEAKVGEYRKIIRAFLLGFGLLIVFLAANRLLSTESLIVLLHDQVFGFDSQLRQAMSKTVNFSYSNQFWLDTKDPVQFMPFYANKTQRAVSLIEIKHMGTGEPASVSIHLDDTSIWEGIDSFDSRLEDLTERIQKPAHLARGENVHILMFRVDGRPEHVGDKVFVRVLTNIIGLEP